MLGMLRDTNCSVFLTLLKRGWGWGGGVKPRLKKLQIFKTWLTVFFINVKRTAEMVSRDIPYSCWIVNMNPNIVNIALSIQNLLLLVKFFCLNFYFNFPQPLHRLPFLFQCLWCLRLLWPNVRLHPAGQFGTGGPLPRSVLCLCFEILLGQRQISKGGRGQYVQGKAILKILINSINHSPKHRGRIF